LRYALLRGRNAGNQQQRKGEAMNKDTTISFYRDGKPVARHWRKTVRQAMLDAYYRHGVDPKETAAIAEQLFICGEARDMFEAITGLEVVLNN
tara:strand:- start:153 stop:431 length:279 start_codon:yes stop_codon:yes gene_type:complete